MIRAVLLAGILLAPSAAPAAIITLESGEHADFSRIVMQFEDSIDWTFGSVKNGYEFRSAATGAEFDYSHVFRRIPKDRISAVLSPGPGRVFFEVSCRCVGDAFEIRNGRVVIDIKDELTAGQEPGELELPELEEGSLWQPVLAETTLQAVVEFVTPLSPNLLTTPDIDAGNDTRSFTNLPPLGSLPDLNGFQIRDHNRISEPTAVSPAPAIPPGRPHETTQLFKIPGLDAPGATIFSQIPARSERIEMAEQGLLEELSRAAMQGLILLERPEILRPIVASSTPGSDPDPQLQLAEDIAPVEPARQNHIRIETAVDRDRVEAGQPRSGNAFGQSCLDENLFDVSQWGGDHTNNVSFGGLQTGIVGEFDAPDQYKILGLVRRYLYLGFGAEARTLMAAFDVALPHGDLLTQMADIVDGGSTLSPGPLATQIGCPTGAAMWAVLSQPEVPAGSEVDTKSVLWVFSSLPSHLRRHLGPLLVERFLAINDLSTAAAIRDIVDRDLGERDPGFYLMQARIFVHDGDVETALRYFEKVANQVGPASVMAVAELIETKLEFAMPVSEKTARLADAFAVEHRGTRLGRRLSRAAIRGFAASGQVKTTFERIEFAAKSGDISNAETIELLAEAHITNALNSSDTEFLKLVLLSDFDALGDSTSANLARQAAAKRLLKLGLPNLVSNLMPSPGPKQGAENQRIVAEANFMMGNFAQASRIVEGLNDDASLLLAARASEKSGNYEYASELFEALEKGEAYESALWRGGDWQGLAEFGSPVRAQAAQLMLMTQGALEFERSSGTADSIEHSADADGAASLKIGKDIVAQSVRAREIINALLVE